MTIQGGLLLISVVLFVLGGFAGWNNADPNYPWRGRLLSWGLAFFAASFMYALLAKH